MASRRSSRSSLRLRLFSCHVLRRLSCQHRAHGKKRRLLTTMESKNGSKGRKISSAASPSESILPADSKSPPQSFARTSLGRR
uniref:Uncharacterized protein n=1 Tax=Leersia perrieri TaxID=77586 RepID=A0A0D9WKB4_9ORYZ